MPLAIGSCVGRVVRHFREGFAMQFLARQSESMLEKKVARPLRQLLSAQPASGTTLHEVCVLDA